MIATDPPNGAVDVAPSRTTVSVTFDQPMAATASVSASPRWGASTTSWSPRWPVSQEIHEGTAMSAAAFAIYPGVAHVFSSDMRRDVQTFFISAMPEPDAVLAGVAALCGLACLAARAGMRRSSA